MNNKILFCTLVVSAGKIEALLKSEGLNIEVCQGQEKLAIIMDQQTFDMIILDGSKPETLYPAAAQVRAHKNHNECPILFMALRKIRFDAPFEGFENAPIQFVLKPYLPEDFLNRVKLLLKVANQRKALIKAMGIIETQKSNVQAILHNMRQGIFTIDRSLTIQPEYSDFIASILDTKQIAGKHINEIFLARLDISSDALSQILHALSISFGEGLLEWEVNEHLLPFDITTTCHDPKELEVEWSPIEKDNKIDKVMVTVRVVTELKALERASRKKDREIKVLTEIVSTPPQRIASFVENSRDLLGLIHRTLTSSSSKSLASIIDKVLGGLHTIKGNSRVCGFSMIADKVHETEDFFIKLARRDTKRDLEYENLILKDMSDLVELYNDVYSSKVSSASRGEGKSKSWQISECHQLLSKVQSAIPDDLAPIMNRLKIITDTSNWESIDDILSGVTQATSLLATQLGKPNPQITIKNKYIRLTQEDGHILEDVFTHLMRNSMDHGLEEASERKLAKKGTEGEIKIDFKLDDQQETLNFIYEDDGRGLDLNRLREVLDTKEADTYQTDIELADTIFEAGVSTSKTVTDISGRGVGMNVIKTFLQQRGGDITLEFTEAKTDQPCRPIRFIGYLPVDVDYETVQAKKAA